MVTGRAAQGCSMMPLALLALLALAGPAAAHWNTAYNHDGGQRGVHSDRLASMSDDLTLADLSIPGTHDTMSFHGGDAVQTQAMSLMDQLLSGVRALDIRCRHYYNYCPIHHGMFYQEANLDDVLLTVTEFLYQHPTEFVLMRLNEGEHTEEGNTRSWEDTFLEYWNRYPGWFWEPHGSANPTVGAVRGRIVLLQKFSASRPYGLDYSSLVAQDDWKLDTNWNLYDKWEKVKGHLEAAKTGDRSTLYINYLSGAGGSFPYFVASGHVSHGTASSRLSTGLTTPTSSSYPDFPRVACALDICTIAFEGTNILAADYLRNWGGGRAGIVMSDFAGGGLIDAIVANNPWPGPVPNSDSLNPQPEGGVIEDMFGFFDDMGNVVESGVTIVENVAAPVIEEVGNVFEDVGNAIADTASDVIDGASDFFSDLFG